MRSYKKYLDIVRHYEECLERYGDTHQGVDWPKREDVEVRYQVMLELIKQDWRDESVKLLDFGCGAAHLYEYIIKTDGHSNLQYLGMDISSKYIELCKSKYPAIKFYCQDVLQDGFPLEISVDYVVMNGVFTEKQALSFKEMWEYFTQLLNKTYKITNKGLAFNVMSKQVDWEREDLFHVPLDLLSEYLCSSVTRNFVIRNDYGLYEYTVYLYK